MEPVDDDGFTTGDLTTKIEGRLIVTDTGYSVVDMAGNIIDEGASKIDFSKLYGTKGQ